MIDRRDSQLKDWSLTRRAPLYARAGSGETATLEEKLASLLEAGSGANEEEILRICSRLRQVRSLHLFDRMERVEKWAEARLNRDQAVRLAKEA